MEAKMFRKIISMIINNVYVNKLHITNQYIESEDFYINFWLFILTNEKEESNYPDN